jgi:hypothetical protein
LISTSLTLVQKKNADPSRVSEKVIVDDRSRPSPQPSPEMEREIRKTVTDEIKAVGGELEVDALPTAHRPNSPPTEPRTILDFGGLTPLLVTLEFSLKKKLI